MNSIQHRPDFTIEVVAENALLLSWQAKISLTQHNEIITLQAMLEQQLAEKMVESVASYHCLLVYFCPQLTTSSQVIDHINSIAKTPSALTKTKKSPMHSPLLTALKYQFTTILSSNGI